MSFTHSLSDFSSQFHLQIVGHEVQKVTIRIISNRHEEPDCNVQIGQQVIDVSQSLLEFLLNERYVCQWLLGLNKNQD